MFIAIFNRIDCNEEQQDKNCCFFSWFSNDIDISIKYLEIFTFFDSPALRKSLWRKRFSNGI